MSIPTSEFKDRLRMAMRNSRLTQQELAERTGISKSSLSQYLSGYAKPMQDRIYSLAEALNVSEAWLIGFDAPMARDEGATARGKRIPVLGSIPAGIPIEAIEDIVDYEDIPADWLDGDSEYFALRVKGDSMSPKYIEGDTVIVKKQPDCESGQDCVAYINGYDATLKKITKVDNGVIVQPINPNYETKAYYDNSVKIAGVVVELRRKI